MNFRIEYRPSELSFDEFQHVDAECFPQDPLNFASFLSLREHDFWGAYDALRLVGYSYVVRKPNLSWLSRICVSQAYRHKGIASAMLQMVIDHARQIGLPDLLLYVQSDNLPASQLYERFCFAIIESAYQFRLVDLQQQFPGQKSQPITAVPILEVEKALWPAFPREWENLAEMHQPPQQVVLLFFDSSRENLGYCRLNPQFPGCFPFVVKQPLVNLKPVLQALHRYQLPGKEELILTFSDEELAQACKQMGMKLNYQLFKMFRQGETGGQC